MLTAYCGTMTKLRGHRGQENDDEPTATEEASQAVAIGPRHRRPARALMIAAGGIALPPLLAALSPSPGTALLGDAHPRLLLLPGVVLIPVLAFLFVAGHRARRRCTPTLTAILSASLVLGLVGAALVLLAAVVAAAFVSSAVLVVMMLCWAVTTAVLGRAVYRVAANLSRSRRRRTVETIRRLHARLRRRVVAARTEERERLRRDLHDGLGPTLSGLRLRLDTAAAHVADDSPARQLLTDAATELTRVTEEVRRAIDGLRPADLDDGDLPVALQRLAARLAHDGLTVRAEVPEDAPPLSDAVQVAAYLIAGEGVTNSLRHAGAGTVTVRLAVDSRHVLLDVADDGNGRLAAGPGDGVGLGSMRRRAEELQGRFLVLNHETGAVVRAILPRSGQ